MKAKEKNEKEARNEKELKIKDLKPGMQDVDIEVQIDFLGEKKSADYGEEPLLPIFVKDDTGEIRMTLWGYKNIKKAKEGQKLKIRKGYISEYRGELQLNTTKEDPVEFV